MTHRDSSELCRGIAGVDMLADCLQRSVETGSKDIGGIAEDKLSPEDDGNPLARAVTLSPALNLTQGRDIGHEVEGPLSLTVSSVGAFDCT